ncbi:hypothetical protein [Sedimentitalea todarodis]|uniref:Uncharacterized protein n=1 Tax=Sedimentitalea todarodis TaxID=1631240 RepID=A0ABU3VMA4_9RHOB|nr:hypothetical protein [Sedimentitalea todarodis]MDU9006809.1 hypothetical protein [Sedimentitalea todarodis]
MTVLKILTQAREAKAHLELAADLHDRKLHDIRERQGRKRFHQWACNTRDIDLIGRFAKLDTAETRLASDDLPDEFLGCAAMQDFIGFVDREASADWTSDYDTSIADAIYSGFVAAALTFANEESATDAP